MRRRTGCAIVVSRLVDRQPAQRREHEGRSYPGRLVVVLADGTTHAIGVDCPGISQTAIAFPWEATIPMGGG